MRTKHKSIALAGLLAFAMTLVSGCYYYDHDDHWRYSRRHDYRYDRYHDGRYYSRFDWDRDHHWRWDHDRYSYRQADPMRNHYND